MDEGILEVSELAGDRVVELRVDELVCHGVIVVRVHGEEGQEKYGEVRREVKGEIEQLREKRSSWMAWRWVTNE